MTSLRVTFSGSRSLTIDGSSDCVLSNPFVATLNVRRFVPICADVGFRLSSSGTREGGSCGVSAVIAARHINAALAGRLVASPPDAAGVNGDFMQSPPAPPVQFLGNT